MKHLFGAAAAISALLLFMPAEAQNAAQPKDIVSFVPDGPILLPGIKFPYFNRDQLMGGDPDEVVRIEQLWAVYVFYHDTQDGERFASLFTPDGVFDQNVNQEGTFVPNSGIGGKGCVLRGRTQISNFIYMETRNAPALTFPHPVHKITSPVIKVDGDEAVMIAPLGATNARTSPTGPGGGIYMIKFKKTAEGWRIQADHLVYERVRMGQNICDLNGSPGKLGKRDDQ